VYSVSRALRELHSFPTRRSSDLVADLRERAARDFQLEGFRDFLALEAGHSENTVEAYLRDLQRMAEFAASKGVRDPGQVSRTLRSEEHTSELQSLAYLVCRLLLD